MLHPILINQPLPLMKGSPPLVFHVDENIRPTVVSRPAAIPAHWRDQVYNELERDVRLVEHHQV